MTDKEPKQFALTPKQQAFIEAYCANGFNASKAAREAGYSVKTSKQMGKENLTKPPIKAAIDRFKAKNAKKAEITIESLIEELDEAQELAKQVGQASVIVSAVQAKAKLLGFDKLSVELTGANGGAVKTDNKYTVEIVRSA